jgi:hypothetical protein
MFLRAATAGLQSVGCDVIDIGLSTTPTAQLAVEHHRAAGGIILTASHNPIEWNALKFIGPDCIFLGAADGEASRRARAGTCRAVTGRPRRGAGGSRGHRAPSRAGARPAGSTGACAPPAQGGPGLRARRRRPIYPRSSSASATA